MEIMFQKYGAGVIAAVEHDEPASGISRRLLAAIVWK